MKRKSIDKSQLLYGARPRQEDAKYLNAYKDWFCVASRNGIDLCGNNAVGAHIRVTNHAGAGKKPDDMDTIPLCSECHADQHSWHDEAEWFTKHVLLPMARRRYRRWKRGQFQELI